MEEGLVRETVSELGRAQEKRHQDVLRHVGSRTLGSAGVMEAFQIVDHILVAQPCNVPYLIVTHCFGRVGSA